MRTKRKPCSQVWIVYHRERGLSSGFLSDIMRKNPGKKGEYLHEMREIVEIQS
jgi:hypothetical protein